MHAAATPSLQSGALHMAIHQKNPLNYLLSPLDHGDFRGKTLTPGVILIMKTV